MHKNNNKAIIKGTIMGEFTYSHSTYGENFYQVDVTVQRLSGNTDIITVIVSERLTDISQEVTGRIVCVEGQYRSYNMHIDNKGRLLLTLFAFQLEYIDEEEVESCLNEIYLDGFICKEPRYKKTPLGREVTEFLMAVNRAYGKSDYIPCICWGRTAVYMSSLEIGTRCQIEGRIQSRQYLKRTDTEDIEIRRTNEVSIYRLEVVTENEDVQIPTIVGP